MPLNGTGSCERYGENPARREGPEKIFAPLQTAVGFWEIRRRQRALWSRLCPVRGMCVRGSSGRAATGIGAASETAADFWKNRWGGCPGSMLCGEGGVWRGRSRRKGPQLHGGGDRGKMSSAERAAIVAGMDAGTAIRADRAAWKDSL